MNDHGSGRCCVHCTTAHEDHDTLTSIDGKLNAVMATIGDHEKRVRRVEQVMFIGIGVIGIIQILMK